MIAVSNEEMERWGCPHCGYRSGSMNISCGGSGIWRCGECTRSSCVLAPGVTEAAFTVGDNEQPKLQDHPRRGIPSHGRPDKRPEGHGESAEFFHARGIGTDITPGCFVCGGDKGYYSNIAAFVQCKEAGERVVKLFARGARLDYRDFEPDRVQVKVGACEKHKPNLEALCSLVVPGILTYEIVQAATGLE